MHDSKKGNHNPNGWMVDRSWFLSPQTWLVAVKLYAVWKKGRNFHNLWPVNQELLLYGRFLIEVKKISVIFMSCATSVRLGSQVKKFFHYTHVWKKFIMEIQKSLGQCELEQCAFQCTFQCAFQCAYLVNQSLVCTVHTNTANIYLVSSQCAFV